MRKGGRDPQKGGGGRCNRHDAITEKPFLRTYERRGDRPAPSEDSNGEPDLLQLGPTKHRRAETRARRRAAPCWLASTICARPAAPLLRFVR